MASEKTPEAKSANVMRAAAVGLWTTPRALRDLLEVSDWLIAHSHELRVTSRELITRARGSVRSANVNGARLAT